MLGHRTWLGTCAATALSLVVMASVADIVLPRWLNLREEPLCEPLVDKVETLLIEPGRTPAILVAGDSRAEWQIVPQILQRELGVDAVNIAVGGGEFISTTKVLRRYGLTEGKPLLIISVSSSLVNDGSVPVQTDVLMAMGWIDQLWISRADLAEMVHRKFQVYSKCLRARTGWFATKRKKAKHFSDDGFREVDMTLDASNPKAIPIVAGKILHPWYKDLHQDGLRLQVFRAALADVAGTGCPVLLLNGPCSPAWRQLTRDTFVDDAERNYVRMIQQEAAQYDNVRVLDFYDGWIDEFPDAMFADIQHLNPAGARHFTMILCDEIRRLNLLDSLEREPPASGAQ
jgi:hypothetical protein